MTPRRNARRVAAGVEPGGGYPYADRVARQACLLDAFDTILDCDFTAFRSDLPALAGIPAEAMITEFGRIMPALATGRFSMAEGFRQILPACGVEPRPGLVSALVSKGRELLLAAARLYDDVLPFLEKLRSRGR